MAKTQLQNQFVKRIDELNDQIWYFLFTAHELNERIALLTAVQQQQFTTAQFAANPFSARIHIPVSQIPTQQTRNKLLTFGAYFSTAYEILSNYVETLHGEFRRIDSLAGPAWDDTKPPETNIRRLCSQNSITLPPAHILRTFSYLRLRRNHFTHLLTTASASFTNFVASNGTHLNNYWYPAGAAVVLDFTNLAHPDRFSQEAAIEHFRILRIILIDMDEYFASQLSSTGIARETATIAFGHENVRRPNMDVKAQRTRNMVGRAKRIFDRTLTDADCLPFLATIGVR